MKTNPLSQFTFLLSLVFSVVYLGLGITLVSVEGFIPWLSKWLQILFGVGCILYAGVRFYRSYLIWQESQAL